MSFKKAVHGEYVSVYLPSGIYNYIERDAARQRIGVATWIRNTALDLCPEEIRNLTGEIRARRPSHPAQGEVAESKAPEQAPAAPPARRRPKDSEAAAFDALVDGSRAQVLALAAKGYRDNAISAIARLPYRVVQHILTTEAATQKKRRKE